MGKREIFKEKNGGDADIDPAVLQKEAEKKRTETSSSRFMEPPLGYKSEGPGSFNP